MKSLSSKCEYCGRFHNGSYGSGRFCCQECARGFSTKAKRKEISKKAGETIRKNNCSPERQEILRKAREKYRKTCAERKLLRKVFVQGDRIDITYGELEEYRKAHPVCEICGRPERVRAYKGKKEPNNLCIDHDHETNKFRGLLCTSCNFKLDWLQGELKNIKNYLNIETL